MCMTCGRRFELKGVHVLRQAVGVTQAFASPAQELRDW